MIVKNILLKIERILFSSLILIFILSSLCFADTIEIRNGMKTTHADKPISLIDTVNKNYSFKWALDKKGNWKLFIRKSTWKGEIKCYWQSFIFKNYN